MGFLKRLKGDLLSPPGCHGRCCSKTFNSGDKIFFKWIPFRLTHTDPYCTPTLTFKWPWNLCHLTELWKRSVDVKQKPVLWLSCQSFPDEIIKINDHNQCKVESQSWLDARGDQELMILVLQLWDKSIQIVLN